MKRSWLHRFTCLRPGKPLERRTPMEKVNRKRRGQSFSRCYGSVSRVLAVKALPCAIPGCTNGPSENAHTLSRGAGGTWRQVVPLCHSHHSEQHATGWQTFRARYPFVDFDALAARLAEELPG